MYAIRIKFDMIDAFMNFCSLPYTNKHDKMHLKFNNK